MAKSKAQEFLTPEKLTLIEGWARDGLTDKQIAHNIGISPCTLYSWEQKHPEFLHALKKGKEVADYEVENALFKRATGYSYEETITEYGEVSKVVKKHVAPDTTAIIYWLKNRRPKKWRDRPEQDMTGENTALMQALLNAVNGKSDE